MHSEYEFPIDMHRREMIMIKMTCDVSPCYDNMNVAYDSDACDILWDQDTADM